MSAEILYVGDVAKIQVSIIDRITKAPVPLPNSPVPVVLKDPTGAETTKSFAPVSDGSDGKFVYATSGGDLSKAGTWYAQPTPTDGVGPFAADPDTFIVKARI